MASPPPYNPNITSNSSSSNKTSNPLVAVDNETGVAADMAAATDLEEYTHREGDKTNNRCRTKDLPQEGCRTRRIGTLNPERGGRTTNAVVNEDNASNNGRITARGAFQQQPNGVPFGNIRNHQGAFQQQPNGPRPLPTNFSYCHTHGYSMRAQHNIAMYKDQAPGH